MLRERTDDHRISVSRAAGAFAVTGTGFSRANLARAMRQALAAGISTNEVIALSVLPRLEAERLIAAR